MPIRIMGTGSFLPEKNVSNTDLEKYVDTSDEWISSRTGIKNRRIAVHETTAGMAAEAAKKALEMAGKDARHRKKKIVRLQGKALLQNVRSQKGTILQRKT